MPAIQIDIILFVLYTMLISGGAWEAHSWYDGNKHATELQAQINATNTAELKADTIAKQFEAASQASRNSQAQLLEKWRVADETPHTVCMLSAAAIGVLHSATIAPKSPR